MSSCITLQLIYLSFVVTTLIPYSVFNEHNALKLVFLTQRVHPFPFRTRKLSFAVPKILVWRRTGKIGRSQHKGIHLNMYPFKFFLKGKRILIYYSLLPFTLIYSSLAQSVERMTVNHDVAGSSPAGGAK